MRDLALYVRVGKTGSSTIQELLLRAAVASLPPPPPRAAHAGSAHWLCTPGMPYGNADCATAELAFGAERLYGSGDVTRHATTWQRGHRMFTTLREPVERAVSEFVYFCARCDDMQKFCGRMSAACVNNNTNFTTWIHRAANQYTRRFYRYWPDMSYLHSYVSGFPELAPVTMEDVDRAVRVLTHESALVLYTDELNTSDMATQRTTLNRLRSWLGGDAACALKAIHTFPWANAGSPETRYVPTAEERRLVCELNWADCQLYVRLRNRSCAC